MLSVDPPSMHIRDDHGYWWIPDRPRLRRPGRLSFSPEVGIELIIQGGLGGDEAFGPGYFPVVLGRSAGTNVTLFECLIVPQKTSMSGRGVLIQSAFEASLGVEGGHFEIRDQLVMQYVSVDFTRLHDWMATASFSDESPAFDEYTVRWKRPPPIQQKTGSVVVTFAKGRHHERAYGEPPVLKELSEITFEHPTGLSWERWKPEFLDPTRDLLAFGLGQPTFMTDIHGFDDVRRPRKRLPRRLSLFYKTGQRPIRSGRILFPDEMTFSLPRLLEAQPDFMASWYRVRGDYPIVWDVLLSARFGEPMFLAHRFLNFAMAGEVLHASVFGNEFEPPEVHTARKDRVLSALEPEDRDWLVRKLQNTNLPSFSKRIEDLVERLGDTSDRITGPRGKFVARITKRRNNLAHRGKGERDALTFYWDTEALLLILEGNLLLEMGMALEAVDHLLRHTWRYRRVERRDLHVAFTSPM
jgi:hypothetical protein